MSGKLSIGRQFYGRIANGILVGLLAACSVAPAPGMMIQPTILPTVLSTSTLPPSTDVPVSQLPSPTVSPVALEVTNTPVSWSTDLPISQPTYPPTRTPPTAEAWKYYNPTPTVSNRAREIYQLGQQMGRDPHAFSKVGDCQNITTYFMANFDTGSYHLGEYTSLQKVIDWFNGSFARESLSVKGGLNVAAVLSPLRADPKKCEKGESPIACEYRVHNPSIAFISMEEAWTGDAEKYGKYLRQVIEFTIEQGIIPIVATKADNLEGGDQINTIIAELAWEYEIPLWNFWVAVQPLNSHGLTADGFHLTHGNNFSFDTPQSDWTGWTMRNLTALQSLEAVWRGLTPQP